MIALITGGAGFIGSHLADRMIADGDEVIAFDDLSTGSRSNIFHLEGHPRFRFVDGSVLDEQALSPLVREADIVFHLAAAVGVRRILTEPLTSITTNVGGTEAVLRAADRWGKKVLVASTSEVYGKNEKHGLTESDVSIIGPTDTARWLYAVSKALDEFLALAYWRERGLPVVIIRFFNTYGPRQTGSYGMVVPRFITQALLDQPIAVFGDGSHTRCFTYVGDAVHAVMALSRSSEAVGQVVNIGSQDETTIEHLAQHIQRLTATSSAIKHVSHEQEYPEGFADMRRRVPDVSKLRRLVGVVPDTPLETGLMDTIAHLRHRIANAGELMPAMVEEGQIARVAAV